MKISSLAERGRIRIHPHGTAPGSPFGAFLLEGPCARELRVVASAAWLSAGYNWDHVSVSTPTRNPNWEEMCFIKDNFFDADDVVVQFHPPQDQYVNNHPHCLHMWRYVAGMFPMPDARFVGSKDLGTLSSLVLNQRMKGSIMIDSRPEDTSSPVPIEMHLDRQAFIASLPNADAVFQAMCRLDALQKATKMLTMALAIEAAGPEALIEILTSAGCLEFAAFDPENDLHLRINHHRAMAGLPEYHEGELVPQLKGW